MGKAQVGTPKHLANSMKSRGLQKLRWFCQVCEKQCRDDNGFKCHTESESHLRQMLVVGENAGKHITDYSSQFQSEFVALLSRRWGTKRVRINQIYQEYIADKSHLHMNATRWLSLTEFTKHLGRTAVCHVEENEEKGWYVTWIDNSPKALARSEASQKKERGDMDDESRQRKLIQEQIERARKEGIKRRIESAGGVFDDQTFVANGGVAEEEPISATTNELVRTEGMEKVSLSLSFKIQPSTVPSINPITTSVSPPLPSTSTSTSLSPPAESSSISLPSTTNPAPVPSSFAIKPTSAIIPTFKPSTNAFKANPLKSNPLKRPNPLKSSSSSTSSIGPKRTLPSSTSNVSKIIEEEMARKARANGSGVNHSSGGAEKGEIDWEKERGIEGKRDREEQERKRAKYSFRG